jgi:AcrR family transcriptional regulator
MTIDVLPLNRRETKKQENRRAIINAGRRVFATLGFGAATVKDIIRESGLAQGSFYNYFDSKEDVFKVVLDEIVRPAQLEFKTLRSQARTAREFVGSAYRACIQFSVQDSASAELIRLNQGAFREAFYLARVSADLRSDLMADLDAGIRSGMFVPHDTPIMAETMVSLGIDIFLLCINDLEESERRIQFLEDLFLRSLAPHECRREKASPNKAI